MEKCPDEFSQNLDLLSLNQLMDYVKLHMPSSHLVTQVQELITKMEDQESTKATPKEEDTAGMCLRR